jgi:hypothetical protein
MLNGKFIGIDRVIEGVYRDFGWSDQLDWIDAVEWTGEIMDMIAAPKQYVDKVTDGDEDRGHQCPIKITNYRGELPCDMIYPVSARDWNSKKEMRQSSDVFHSSVKKNDENNQTINISTPFDSPLIKKGAVIKNDLHNTDLTYTINDQHIFTNFEEGEVELAYKGFPTDCNGLPLIPDNVKYVQAVKYYIAEKIAQRMFIQGNIAQGVFQYIQQQRDWYVGAATTAGLMPSIDEMESWKNQMVRLIPTINEHSAGFKYHGDKPRQRNHNSY